MNQMDYDSEKRKRLQALEDKKKRLEEMRKRSKDKSEETVPDVSQPSMDSSNDVDNLVNSILSVNLNSNSLPRPPTEGVSQLVPTPETKFPFSREEHVIQKRLSLTCVRKLSAIHILPVLRESYDKSCQTDDSGPFEDDKNALYESPDQSSKPLFRRSTGRLRPAATPTTLNFTENNSTQINSVTTPTSKNVVPKKLNPELLREIIHSETYKHFIDNSSKIMERALGQSSYDIFKDYTTDTNNLRQNSDSKTFSILNTFDDEFVKSRPVMDIHPSPHHGELFLAAYGAKGQALHNRGVWQLATGSEEDPAGAVCVWSLALSTRPEFKFSASSPVLTAQFHPVDEHLIVGGSYSGQILLWDMRAKALPIQRSNLAGKGHKHPVYSLSMLGSTSVCELVTASTDGTLCHWDLSQLAEPTISTPLLYSGTAGGSLGDTSSALSGPSGSASDWTSNSPVNVTSMAFGQGDTSREVVLGSESGTLFRTTVPLGPAEKIHQIAGHLGLVTAMDIHPNSGKTFKNLLLTSSLDWTVKLWNLHQSPDPIFEFHTPSYDYVCDVQWSPIHPAVFTTITSGGALALWNISKSIVEPLDTIRINSEISVTDTVKSSVTISYAALNRAVWSLDGRRIIVGDAKGTVHVVSVAESAAKPKLGDEGRLELAILHRKESVPMASETFAGQGSDATSSSMSVNSSDS